MISAAFPPDDRSLGWERGTTVSKAWDQAATDAAVETAGYVTAHLQGAVRRRERRRGPRGETARVLPPFRRTGLPPAAHRRAEASLHRPPVRRGRRPGDGREARGAAGAAVAALPVPRDRGRPRRLRHGQPALLRPLGFAARPGTARRRGRRPAGHARTGRRPGRADAGRRAGPRQAPRVPAPVAADRPRPGRGQGRRPLPRLRPGRRRRPADFARPVPRRRDLERRPRLPPAAAGRRSIPERPAGEVLRRRPAGRRPVPEGEAEPATAGRRAHPSLPDGGLRPHVGDIADPPRRLSGARRPRPDAAAAAGGVHAAGRRATTPT